MDIDDLIGDEAAQAKGVELEFKPGTGLFFTLLYALKGKPRDYQTRKLNDVRRSNNGETPSDKSRKVHIDTLVHFVVIGWRGLCKKDAAGKPVEVEYSKPECRNLLERSPVTLDWITTQSQDLKNFGGNPDGDESDEPSDEPATEDAPVGASKSAAQ